MTWSVRAAGKPARRLAAGFFWTNGGFEYPLLWGVVALGYALRGGGRFSLDAAIGREG